MASGKRIFSPEKIELNSELSLDDERARYVGHTLRLKTGDRFTLFDGSGGEYRVVITRMSKGQLRVRAEQHENPTIESPLPIHLLQGVSRGDRMDTVVQKSTELGVSRLSPVLTRYSVVKFEGERAAKRSHHWRRVAQSACEQCGRNTVPEIDAPATLAEWLDSTDRLPHQKLLLHSDAAENISTVNLQPHDMVILTGPEGGLSRDEIEQAVAAGFKAVSLGPRILRTETAAIAATAILQARFGDI